MLELVPLFLSLHNAPSLLQGAETSETISIAGSIIKAFDSRKVELPFHHLLFLGIALSHPSCIEGNSLLIHLVDFTAQSWVIESLMEREGISEMNVLEGFWLRRDMDSLLRVVATACTGYWTRRPQSVFIGGAALGWVFPYFPYEPHRWTLSAPSDFGIMSYN